jgi:ABC-type transport system involved in cytochrome bd biosynthesis fused ATPase/permease subunit
MIAVIAAVTIGALCGIILQPRRLQLVALIPSTFAALCFGAVLFTSSGWTLVVAAVCGGIAIYDGYRRRSATQG